MNRTVREYVEQIEREDVFVGPMQAVEAAPAIEDKKGRKLLRTYRNTPPHFSSDGCRNRTTVPPVHPLNTTTIDPPRVLCSAHRASEPLCRAEARVEMGPFCRAQKIDS